MTEKFISKFNFYFKKHLVMSNFNRVRKCLPDIMYPIKAYKVQTSPEINMDAILIKILKEKFLLAIEKCNGQLTHILPILLQQWN